MSQIIGHISQVIGPVVDVYFDGTDAELVLPSIHEALEIKRPNGKKLIVEVQQHIGENTVRTVAFWAGVRPCDVAPSSAGSISYSLATFSSGSPIIG